MSRSRCGIPYRVSRLTFVQCCPPKLF
uniref:Uncharacterized protein n=1 Tax=Arundo donax TaxID=35708 RepID=A0A0A9DZK5_ARUDO